VSIESLVTVVALAQVVFVLGVCALLLGRRDRLVERHPRRWATERALTHAVQRWLRGDGRMSDVASLLASLPPEQALEQLVVIAKACARPSQRAELRDAVRPASWVRTLLDRSRSNFWWRRREAGRALAIVGTERDRVLLQMLLDDPHPAVQGAAASSLPFLADRGTIGYVLDALPERSMVVRLHQFRMLEDTLPLTTPALLERLTADAPPRLLKPWITLAESLGSAELLERVGTLHGHSDPLIRVSVARALKRSRHPDAEELLLISLHDPDWRVRAVAARSLGALGDPSAVSRLAAGMRDVRWRVRFRCAIALSQLGEEGRVALEEARGGTDRFAAEMATLIGALSPDSVSELAEA
jgi:HEAT repeat protein